VQKILWLVDPYEELKNLRSSALWVKGLSQSLKAPVQPVHVLSGGAAGFAPEIHAAWLMQFVVDTEERLARVVAHFKLPHLLEPHVISEVYRSRSEAVSGFLEFAAEAEADLIVLQRAGGGRKKMGGFAETLLLKSGIPVLIVPPGGAKVATYHKVKRLLVALDLSDTDREVTEAVFDRSLEWAKKMRASLHLFHVLPLPPTVAYGPGAFDLGASAAAAAYWSEEATDARKRELERFRKLALKKGVACTVELETRSVRPADAILRAQKRTRADWLVMAGKSGRWSTLILGSVTRMVARDAPCPVWVIHLDRKSEAKAA
jgi:nucleotide-binding universal stress UspA family protein